MKILPPPRELTLIGFGAALAFLIEDISDGKTGSAILMLLAAMLLGWDVWRNTDRKTPTP